MKKIIALPAMTITLAASYILHSVSYDPIVDSDDVTEISIQNESQFGTLFPQNSAQAKQNLASNKTTADTKNLTQAKEPAKAVVETIEVIPFIVPESASQTTLAGDFNTDDNNSFITINNDGIEEHIIVEE